MRNSSSGFNVLDAARPLRYFGLWRALGFILIAGILLLSLIPIQADLGENKDKIGHFLAYGSLMFWFGVLYPSARRQLVTAIAFCAMGIGVEFLQGMTSYRSFEVADMVANSVGVAIGWCVAFTPLKHALACSEKLILRSGVS